MIDGSAAHRDFEQSIVLTAPARLHFGLLEISSGEPHQFGGLGVSIAQPQVRCRLDWRNRASPDDSTLVVADDSMSRLRIERAMETFRLMELALDGRITTAGKISVEAAIPSHQGLGSGTQLNGSVATLFVAKSVFESGLPHRTTADQVWQRYFGDEHIDTNDLVHALARSSGRGLRSFVGLGTHLYGGLIVDHGLHRTNEPRRTIQRYAVPNWHVVLVRSDEHGTISGEREKDYFSQCESPNRHKDRMLGLIQAGIVPAVEASDFVSFCEAVYEFGYLGGLVFEPVQGGPFRNQGVEAIVKWLRGLGYCGVGQSSWGPTVYTIVETVDEANWLISKIQTDEPKLNVAQTQLSNSGATVVHK